MRLRTLLGLLSHGIVLDSPYDFAAAKLAAGGYVIRPDTTGDTLSPIQIGLYDVNGYEYGTLSDDDSLAIFGRNITTSKRLISLGARSANGQSYLGIWSANNEVFFDIRAPQTQFTVDVQGIGIVRVQNDGFHLLTGRVVEFPNTGGGSSVTRGFGLAPIFGLDNRSGVTVADGSPIVLYAVPAGANQLFDVAIEINATAYTSGTATYTLTYTQNGVAQTIVVTATVLNVVTGVRRLIQPDPSTNVTVQLTGPFVATCRLSAAVMQLA